MAKVDSIRVRYIDEFIKGLLILFDLGNYSNIKVRITNRKYNVY